MVNFNLKKLLFLDFGVPMDVMQMEYIFVIVSLIRTSIYMNAQKSMILDQIYVISGEK